MSKRKRGKSEIEIDKLWDVRDDLWRRIQHQELSRLPFPGELSEDEQQSLIFMRLAVEIGEEITEEELIELISRAERAKAEWDFYRAAMAGNLNLKIDKGKLLLSLTERFKQQNKDLLNDLRKKGIQ